MGNFFFGILIYYSFLGFLVGLNLINIHSKLSILSFSYSSLLLINGLWAWRSKKKIEANYQVWIFLSLIFWPICLWNTGKLGSPYLFFSFLLAFHNAFLNGIRSFYLTLIPLVIISLYFLFFDSHGDASLYSEVLSSKTGWGIIYKVFFFLGPCLPLIELNRIKQKSSNFFPDANVMMSFNASKMATLSEMAGGVSHEINNPLTIIVGQIYTLKKIPKKNDVTENVEKILIDISEKLKENSSRISKIIKELRNFAKDGSQDPFEIVELKPVISNSFELYLEKLKNYSFEIEVECEDDLTVFARKVELQQAFSNLVINSFDFGKGEEKSWIKIVVSKKSNKQIEILFSDSGNGIEEPIREKIFEPFFSTELPKKTGLGLSISQSIFQNHSGSIELVNQPQTCFKILLPFREKKEEVS